LPFYNIKVLVRYKANKPGKGPRQIPPANGNDPLGDSNPPGSGDCQRWRIFGALIGVARIRSPPPDHASGFAKNLSNPFRRRQ
jgi:hypothetical protein